MELVFGNASILEKMEKKILFLFKFNENKKENK